MLTGSDHLRASCPSLCSSYISKESKRRIIFPSLHQRRDQKSDAKVHKSFVAEVARNKPIEECHPTKNELDTFIRLNVLPIASQRGSHCSPKLEKRYPVCINFPVGLPLNHSHALRSEPTECVDVSSSLDTMEVRSILVNKSQFKYTKRSSGVSEHDKATNYCEEITDVSSVVSDIPSLDSSSVSTSSDNHGSISSVAADNSAHRIPTEKRVEDRVKFEHSVRVREFQRSAHEKAHMWFTRQEMHSFKAAALQRILEYNIDMSSATLSASTFADATEIAGTGTGRVVPMQSRTVKRPQKILFTHRALSPDSIDSLRDTECSTDALFMPLGNSTYNKLVRSMTCGNLVAKQSEIRLILVVDSHDVCLNLFTKGLLRMFPCAKVITARSGEEALGHAASCSKQDHVYFDLIIVEERLKLRPWRAGSSSKTTSGSMLLRELQSRHSRSHHAALYIGVSAHINDDAAKLKEHGADIVWSKPPPLMDQRLRDAIVAAIDGKRKVG
jgi:CheY-like chemotaxis protein